MKPLVGLSLMHETDFLNAALPLFIENKVDVLEWSFDTIRYHKNKPNWLHQLLTEYSDNRRLIGHGVRYSLFDAKFTKRQTTWLKQLQQEVKRYQYNHISEHFGFMSSTNFHEGAPLPVPLNKNTLAIGVNRLQHISNASGLPVGIENLAFSFSLDDVKEQGVFLDKLTEPIKGFIILDLHNIYCQAKNFKIDVLDLVKMYPLKKVREIHISGGSWQNSAYAKDLKKVRRDTHDEKVPKEIFDVLPDVLKLCKNVEYVIFERLGHTLVDVKEQKQFRKDFLKLKDIVNSLPESRSKKQERPASKQKRLKPLNNAELNSQQKLILSILRNSTDPFEAIDKLNNPKLKDWNTQNWKPSMVETAMELIKKWG